MCCWTLSSLNVVYISLLTPFNTLLNYTQFSKPTSGLSPGKGTSIITEVNLVYEACNSKCYYRWNKLLCRYMTHVSYNSYCITVLPALLWPSDAIMLMQTTATTITPTQWNFNFISFIDELLNHYKLTRFNSSLNCLLNAK